MPTSTDLYAPPVLLPERGLEAGPELPNAALLHFERGGKLSFAGKLTEAIAEYEAVVAVAPSLAEAHNNRGAALDRLGSYEEALTAFDTALELRPDHAKAREGHRLAVEALLRRLARRGIISWAVYLQLYH